MKKRVASAAAALAILCGCAQNQTEIQTEVQTETTAVSVTEQAGSVSVTEETADTAAVEDYIYEIIDGEAHINKYTGKETEVVIPDSMGGCPVTFVSRRAFSGLKPISITFPETVKELGKLDIYSLERLYLPAGIKELTAENFKACDSLREISIAEGGRYKSVDGGVYTADGRELVYLPRFACEGKFTVPDGVVKIGDYACQNSRISELACPDSLREMGRCAFEYNKNIWWVTLNEGLEYIGEYAFRNYSDKGIHKLNLPDSIKSVGKGFVNNDVPVSAAYDTEGLSALYELNSVEYRNEVDVRQAVRMGINKLKKQFSGWDANSYRAVFSDIIGDAYPEILIFDVNNNIFDMYSYVNKDWKNSPFYWLEEGWSLRDDFYAATCYDSENDSYFDLKLVWEWSYETNVTMCAYRVDMADDSQLQCSNAGYSSVFYPVDSFSGGALVNYQAGDCFEIKYYTPDELENAKEKIWEDFKSTVISSLEGCEVVREYSYDPEHFSTLLEGSGEQIIYDGNFSDMGEIEAFDYSEPERKIIGEIGNKTIYEDVTELYLYDSDIAELSYKDFTLLSKLPELTRLKICGYRDKITDLSGIEQLSGLKYLSLSGSGYKSTEKLSELKELEWLIIDDMDDISFLSEMDSLRVLSIAELYGKPDEDYYSPLYDMEELEFLIAKRSFSPCDAFGITIAQEKALREKRPDVKVVILS